MVSQRIASRHSGYWRELRQSVTTARCVLFVHKSCYLFQCDIYYYTDKRKRKNAHFLALYVFMEVRMNTKFTAASAAAAIAVIALLSFYSCASTGSGAGGLSLLDAIEQSAEKIAAELPKGSRVAVVAFETESDSLSDFIMAELSGALHDRNIEIVERQGLEYVMKELNFQMSGAVSDETAHSLGKFMGAQLITIGQFRNLGDLYRLTTNAVWVEQATRASIPRFDVRNDRALKNMIAALSSHTIKPRVANYGVTVNTTPQSAGTFLDRGILFAMQNEFDKAVADFSEALRLNPGLLGAYILRARALVASVSYVTSVEENFGGINTAITIGEQASAKQAAIYDRAIEDLTQATRLDPNNSVVYGERGTAYAHKGDYDRAIADYTQTLSLDPNNAVAYNNRGGVYNDKGDYDRAIADFNQAIKLNPHYAMPHTNRGNAYTMKGDLDKAIADYTQAIQLDPNYATTYSNRGSAYNDKGDFDRAIADCTQAIRLDPNYAMAYLNRGNSYLNKGDLDQAIADYTQTLRLDPTISRVYSNRSNAYTSKGDFDKAIADCTQAIRLNPNNERAYYNRANAYREMGDYDRSIADYTEAIRINPNYINAYNNRGIAYIMKGDYNRAIADWEVVLRLNPNDANAKQNIEYARQQRGR